MAKETKTTQKTAKKKSSKKAKSATSSASKSKADESKPVSNKKASSSSSKGTASKKKRASKKSTDSAKSTAKKAKSAKKAPQTKKPPAKTAKKVTKEKKPAKVRKPVEAAPEEDEPLEEVVIKTKLKPNELEEFRRLLLTKRAELMGDMGHLQNEALRQGSSGESANGSFMPIHMADIGSDTWEQELTLGLIENERELLREIDEALDRINNETYGICLATGKPITKSRLRAKPWAKYCIEYARKRELGLV